MIYKIFHWYGNEGYSMTKDEAEKILIHWRENWITHLTKK